MKLSIRANHLRNDVKFLCSGRKREVVFRCRSIVVVRRGRQCPMSLYDNHKLGLSFDDFYYTLSDAPKIAHFYDFLQIFFVQKHFFITRVNESLVL